MTIPAAAAAARAGEFYDRWSPLFLDHAGPIFQSGLIFPAGGARSPESSVRHLGERAGLTRGMRLLDAGCGVGGPAAVLATEFGVDVDGVTISCVQARLGRQHVRRVGASARVRLHVADFHRLPFRDSSFDAVVIFEAIVYSHDLDCLITELARVLRPGGTLYVKDVFRREGPLDHRQESELCDYHDVWGCTNSWTMAQLRDAMARQGMATASTTFPDVNIDHFVGSMVDLDPEEGFVRNEVGRHFFRTYRDLPVLWGEVVGHRPTAVAARDVSN